MSYEMFWEVHPQLANWLCGERGEVALGREHCTS